MSTSQPQPWVHSASVDGLFIVGPGLFAVALSLLLQLNGYGASEVSLLAWAVLIVGIDVAHVYATLYRTYFDPIERTRLSGLLWFVPLVGWLVGVLLYSSRPLLFWTALAYLAVFHFVRQQYGFLMIYSRRERALPQWCRALDKTLIYSATIVPMIYWHTHLPRSFNWFVDDEFIALPSSIWGGVRNTYLALLGIYLVKELWLLKRGGAFNVARNALLISTVLSWYMGIVVSDGDLVYTLTNVVAHGIPYIALTAIYMRNQEARAATTIRWFSWKLLPLSIGLLVLLAYAEEWLWDGLVWREHLQLFPLANWLPTIRSTGILSLVVPLLILPQLTHYLLDAVIWRLREHPEWSATLFWKSRTEEMSS